MAKPMTTKRSPAKHTLEELLASTPTEAWNTSETAAWDLMPAVGREWPNEGWDETLETDERAIDGNAQSR